MEENKRQEYLARAPPSPQSLRIACTRTKKSWESRGLLAPTVSNLDPREIDATEQISVEFLLIVIHFSPLAPCTEKEDPPILNTSMEFRSGNLHGNSRKLRATSGNLNLEFADRVKGRGCMSQSIYIYTYRYRDT